MGNVLYTCGYGGRKPEDFIALLKDNGIQCVIDVRRWRSGAFIQKYRPGNDMRDFLREQNITYSHDYWLSNEYDLLVDYRRWIKTVEGFNTLKLTARDMCDNVVYCILCAEKAVFKEGLVNCHRVYVAEELVKLLGEGWEVKHL